MNQQTKKYKLVIAGSGREEENIKQLALVNEDIEWAGYVNGINKQELLLSSQIMFFPSYSEGMPLTILEGMMYGMPIISRPVGGIPDQIENDRNGFLIKSLYPEDYAVKILKIVNTPDLYRTISQNNLKKSEQFAPKTVRERLYKLYEITYHGK